MAVWVLVLAFVTGCGRIGFAPRLDVNDDGLGDGAAPRWALVQTVASTTSPLTVAPSRAADLIVVAVHTSLASMVNGITDDAGNSYVAIPAARATDANPPDNLEVWYAQNAQPNTTTIAVTASNLVSAVMWEVSGIRTASPLDVVAVLDNQPATTTPSGPSITTSTAGELVISVAIVANGVSGTHPGNEFTNDHKTRGNGWAHLTDPAAPAGPHQAEWDQTTSGTYCATAVAFLAGP